MSVPTSRSFNFLPSSGCTLPDKAAAHNSPPRQESQSVLLRKG